jgi:single-strand DNA-binding protein
MNSINITGTLTADVEVKETNSDWKALNFSIANNDETRKKEDGTYEDIASFFNVTLWTKGDKMQRHLLKGKQVAVNGRLKQDRWESEGNKRSAVKIIASEVKPFVWQNSDQSENSGQNATNSGQKPDDNFTNIDQDVPF